MCGSRWLAARHVVLVICALTWLGGSAWTEEPAPPAAGASSGFKAATLEKRITVAFDGVPLADAAKQLSEKINLPILIDRKALDDAGIEFTTPVTLTLADVKARKVLDRLCDSVDLVWVPRDGLLSVTTRDDAENLLETRVYDVRDLYDYQLEDSRRMNPESFDSERSTFDGTSLAQLIASSVDPNSFFGGPGSIASFGGTVVISNTFAMHEKVEAFLAKLRDTLQRRTSKRAAAVVDPATDAMRRALNETSAVDFAARPLNAAMQVLAEKQKIAIRLLAKPLDDAGVALDMPVTFQAKNLPLGVILDRLLAEHDLTYVTVDDELLVTTKDDAGNRSYPEVYDVHDLIVPQSLAVSRHQSPSAEGEKQYDYESFISLVTSTTAPTSWEGSGPGDGSPYLGTITWRQTQKNHAEIAALLAKLREVHKRPIPTLTDAAAAPQPAPVDPTALELRVYKLGWWLEGPQPEKKDQPADGTKPAAEKKDQAALPAGVLPQFGVGGGGSGGGGGATMGYRPSAESLRYTEEIGCTIVGFIEPQSWREAGGQGLLRSTPSAEHNVAGMLIIRQTPAVHQQIRKLLRDMRALSTWQGGLGGGGQGGGFF